MTNTVKYGLGFLGVGIPAAAGSPYLIRHLQRPNILGKRLEFDGHVPVLDNEASKWWAKFIDYGEEIREKIGGLSDSDTASNDDVSKLKGWCKEAAEKGAGDANYDDYLNFCSSNYKTIQAKLLSDQLTPASSDDDFKLLFLIHRYDPDFLAKVNGSSSPEQTLTRQSTKDEGYAHVKAMCEPLIYANFDQGKYGEASTWCTQPTVDKVAEKLETLLDFERLGDGDYDQLDSRWKSNTSYATAIGAQGNGDTKAKLRDYCSTKYEATLLSLTNYDGELKNVYNFCNKKATWDVKELREIIWTT